MMICACTHFALRSRGKETHSVNDITLSKFVSDEKELFDKFQLFWLTQNQINPDDYPMSMSPGEWMEQFSVWSP